MCTDFSPSLCGIHAENLGLWASSDNAYDIRCYSRLRKYLYNRQKSCERNLLATTSTINIKPMSSFYISIHNIKIQLASPSKEVSFSVSCFNSFCNMDNSYWNSVKLSSIWLELELCVPGDLSDESSGMQSL